MTEPRRWVTVDGETFELPEAVKVRLIQDLGPLEPSPENIEAIVAAYLEEHPPSDYVDAALASHRAEDTPHAAYDARIPTLKILFANRLI